VKKIAEHVHTKPNPFIDEINTYFSVRKSTTNTSLFLYIILKNRPMLTIAQFVQSGHPAYSFEVGQVWKTFFASDCAVGDIML
jgi:hypothetical protein